MKKPAKLRQYQGKRRRAIGCISEALEGRTLFSSGLAITYAPALSTTDVSGLSTLSYNGTQLINDSNYQQEFQVPRYYTLNTDGTYNSFSGETGFTSNWNASNDTLTYTYSWGTLTTQYVQVGANRLNMVFNVHNSATSGVTLGGIDIYPAYVHYPNTITPTDEQQIAGAAAGTAATPLWSPELADGSDGPAVEPADYSGPTNNGAVMTLANDGAATRQMYTALWTANYNGSTPGEDYFIMAATAPDQNMLHDQSVSPQTYTEPLFYTNTAPGQSDSFELSLRFGAAGTDPLSLTNDIESNYALAYPDQTNWPDNRPIASLHLASEGSSTATNPNAWTLGGYVDPSTVNVDTTAGLDTFSAGLLNYASTSIAQMTQNHAQGMVVWDLEGEQYPQPNPSYIGDPRYADDPSFTTPIAPELGYNYNNNGPLVNQFFSAFTNAGFRVGLTLRPTQIVETNGTYSQTPNNGLGAVPYATEVAQLEAKIAYASSQWGCTLFYVDSTSGQDAAALRTVQLAYPNVLLIPEHNTVSTFSTSASYGELNGGDYTGTPSSVLHTYPNAISVIYDADGNMSNYQTQLRASIGHGDIILFRGWYADANDAAMEADYQAEMTVPGQVSLIATPADSAVNLTWNNLVDHAVYNIKRATSANGTYVPIAYGAFGTSYTDTTVTNFQTYYYKVTAVNGVGTGPDSSASSATPGGPTIATAAAASPTTVAGKTSNLSVLGADQGGESTLLYNWASTSTPANAPAPTFSANGTNLAKNTTAHFYQAGTYVLTVTVRDPSQFYITSTVTVVVSQTVTSMYPIPGRVTVTGGGTQQYTVKATDQYSNTIASPPVTWNVSGGGTISSTGLFTAGQTGGVYTITATSGAYVATTTVTVQAIGGAAMPAVLLVSPASVTTPLAFDIASDDLIVHNGGASALSAITSRIAVGANFTAGYWNGSSGIFSSSAAADSTYLTAVGVMLNNSNNAAAYTTFDNKPTALNDVLIKYTYYGDANLDGQVDGSDYTKIDNGYANHLTGWANGDFNYDGIVDGSDYTLMDNAFNAQPQAKATDLIAANTARVAKGNFIPPVSSETFATASSSTRATSSASSIDDLLEDWKTKSLKS